MSIKTRLRAAIEFTKNISTTGAVSETSIKVEEEITSKLPLGPNKIIVEFGLGHGNITQRILSKISPSSRLYSFEINKKFCAFVRDQIKDERLTIINDSAENIGSHFETPIDGMVSSIPLTFFAEEKKLRILNTAHDHLIPGGNFSQILYSKKMKKSFETIFEKDTMVRVPNLPIAYVHHCKKNR